MVFHRKGPRYVVDLSRRELSDLRDALILLRNKLITENRPVEDFDALIIKICRKF